jgi:hypothetical protein
MPFNSIFAWLIKKRVHQIELFRKFPLEVQQETFDRLVSNASQTEFGKKYKFGHIDAYAQFRDQVPLQHYEDVKPWVDRLMAGEQNLLWPTETKWFAKSSGTTSDRSKLIPVTREALEDCHQKGGKDLLALYYSNHPNGKLYKGKHLVIGGSTQTNPLSDASFSGDLSAIILKTLPWWAEIRRTPAREIALMSEWEEKIEKIAQSTIHEDVGILCGVPSWTMVLCNRVLELTDKKHLKEVWPNLELFMHGGVSFEPYREQFRKLIPCDKMNYVESYNASEGFFGIQDHPDSKDMLLMLDYGVYFEFIPMQHFKGVDSEVVINLSEVNMEENYAVVISTNGGLWRYIIGDTIKFTGLKPFRFKITGRTKNFINTFGEELIVDNAERGISYACSKTDAQIRDYTAGPIFMAEKSNGGHEWLIEFTKKPNDLNRFALLLDEKLRAINSDYDAKRYKNMVLALPLIKVLTPGTFDRWLKSKGKLGGQNKVPRLANNREYLEQIVQWSIENKFIQE